MIDLDNRSANKECAMVGMDLHCEDLDECIIMYGDQEVSMEEHD